MNQGLHGSVLSLSTGGCTVDVGNLTIVERPKWGALSVAVPLQHDATAADIGELTLEGVDLFRA
jgi:hypothetical protein